MRNITMLHAQGAISCDLMVEAAERGITIHVLGTNWRSVVRIGPPDAPLFHLSQRQTAIASSHETLVLAAIIVMGKIRNQMNLLQYFGKCRS